MSDFRPTHRHYKGGLYKVIAFAQHSETLEPMTVYVSDAGAIWVRPSAMFNDVLPDGQRRFDPLPPEERVAAPTASRTAAPG